MPLSPSAQARFRLGARRAAARTALDLSAARAGPPRMGAQHHPGRATALFDNLPHVRPLPCRAAIAKIKFRHFAYREHASTLAAIGEGGVMRFGLFGSAQARRPAPGAELTDSSQGFRDWIENNVAAESLGYHSTFVVEHHFTGFGQVSASLNLLTWLGARTSTLRLGTALLVLPWPNPGLLPEQAPTPDLLSGRRLAFRLAAGF